MLKINKLECLSSFCTFSLSKNLFFGIFQVFKGVLLSYLQILGYDEKGLQGGLLLTLFVHNINGKKSFIGSTFWSTF